MALYLNSETETAILNLQRCFKSVHLKQIVRINRDYIDDIELCQEKTLLLDEIEKDFDSDFPSNRNEILKFFENLNQVGLEEVDNIAAKVGQKIFEFLKAGVTLQSLGSNVPPTPEELDRWTSYKGSELLVYLVNQECKIEEDSKDYEKLNDYAYLIALAIVNFFRNGYNTSGPAINAALVSGVGTLMFWAVWK